MTESELAVLQHGLWLGRLPAASVLRRAGITTGAHLAVFNLGLKSIPVDRRRHRGRESRLLAIAHGLIAAAEFGLKEHDRLALARQLMERKLTGRRTSSKLPELIELVMAKPMVSAGMVVKTLEVTPRLAAPITSGECLPPVAKREVRWSAFGLTMYGYPSRLLVANLINRYLLNTPMLTG